MIKKVTLSEDFGWMSFILLLKDTAYGALIGAAIIPCILIVLCLMGFTCRGIAAGSYAAIRQA